MRPETTEVRKNIYRASLMMMASVLLSRVIGFFREWVLARTVGASAMTDVYYASFTIPDFLNYLMAAGALSISFIPILSAYIAQGKGDTGKLVFRSISTIMGLILVLFILIAEIFSDRFAVLIAPGFSLEQLQLLAYLIRIILPAQFFIFWGGLAISVQHTHGKFFCSALAPILYNGGIILFGVLLHRSHGVVGFSIGVLVGAIVSHGVTQWWGIRTLGYSILPYFRLNDDIIASLKKYFWLSLPIMLGFSIVVTDEWFSKYFASSLEQRAVSWLSYARTEMRIPIAVIGQAAGIASFPYLSRLWSEGKAEAYGKTLLREIEKLWAAAPIAAVLLFFHALPITHLIYGGGRLTFDDLTKTAAALKMFGLGVFFWTLQVLLARGFYACQKTWLPSVIGTALSILTLPLYWFLAMKYSFEGLALAGTIGIAVYCTLLWIYLRRHLRKHCPTLSYSQFYTFCCGWAAVIGVCGVVAWEINKLGLYQQTRSTAAIDVVVVSGLLVLICLGLLRTVFAKYTDGPLF